LADSAATILIRQREAKGMKIYTRTGDQGETGLYGGLRVAKNDPRITVSGVVDEFNALLGLARAEGLSPRIDTILERLQNQLFDLGAELATPEAADRGVELLQESDVEGLESAIDELEIGLAPLKTFILPGGTKSAAQLHLARSVCRRAEREIVAWSQYAPVRELVLKFVNRTSDLLFVLARAVNAEAGQEDVPWNKDRC